MSGMKHRRPLSSNDKESTAADRVTEYEPKMEANLARIEMPNDSPEFIETLFDLVTAGTGARISNLNV